MKLREAFPILYVQDVETALAFYERLGFRVSYRWPPDGRCEYAFLRLEPLGIGLARTTPQRPRSGFELCVYTDGVDAAVAELEAAGAKVVERPVERPWGERVAYVLTPDAHLLHVTQKLD